MYQFKLSFSHLFVGQKMQMKNNHLHCGPFKLSFRITLKSTDKNEQPMRRNVHEKIGMIIRKLPEPYFKNI